MLINYIKPDFVHQDERGGHFHKINKEIFFVIRGLFRLVLESNNEKEVYIMKTGDFFEIEKGIKHTFEYIEDTELISMYDLGVELENDEKDIYR